MTKFSLAWISSFLVGSVLLVFQAISSLIGSEGGVWQRLSLIDIFDEGYFSWFENVSWLDIGNMVEYIITMPLFILLFCIGGLFLVLDYFFERR